MVSVSNLHLLFHEEMIFLHNYLYNIVYLDIDMCHHRLINEIDTAHYNLLNFLNKQIHLLYFDYLCLYLFVLSLHDISNFYNDLLHYDYQIYINYNNMYLLAFLFIETPIGIFIGKTNGIKLHYNFIFHFFIYFFIKWNSHFLVILFYYSFLYKIILNIK